MYKEKEENTKKSVRNVRDPGKSKSFFTDERIKFVFGILITGFALYLLLACIAYLFWWKTDQSLPDSDIVSGPDVEVKNWSGKSGHFLCKNYNWIRFWLWSILYSSDIRNHRTVSSEFSKNQAMEPCR